MNKKKISLAIPFGCLAVIALALGWSVAKDHLKPDDFEPFVRWFLTVFLVGISFYPLAACLFRKFSDKGYFFGKVLGIVISGWLVWVLSSIHLVKFTAVSCYVILGLCALVNYGLAVYLCRKKKIRLPEFFGLTDGSAVPAKALWYEVFFFVLFAALTYLKCFNPEANGTERFMDYGFMTSMMKSSYMPPEDFWFSGTSLNYYYLGQFFATYLTKLSGITVNYGYNLALMMTASFCMILVYSLVSRIFEVFMGERADSFRQQKKKTIASEPFLVQVFCRIAGILSGLAVTFASSCHYFVYAKLVPVVREILGIEGTTSYWFPDATRYIGYQREGTGDKTIHEFPSYSFVLGDLHAHVTNIIFVLTLLAVLFAWLLYRRERMKKAAGGVLEPVVYKAELLQPHIIVLSFFIGIFQMTNYWDFPIYFVVCGAVILVSNAVICGFTKKTFLLTALHAAEFIVIAFVTALMFTLRFDSMAGGIGLCSKHTELYQLIVVWALPVFMVLGYLGTLIKEERIRRKERPAQSDHRNPFFAWLQNLKASELFLIILGLCAIGLVLLPEVVYVVDIYGGDFQRANTMFKLTYQAFILFGICMGAVITRYLLLPGNVKQVAAGLVLLFFLYRNLGYFGTSCETWFGDYKDAGRYKTLDAGAYIYDVHPEDAKAIAWMNENLEGRPVVLEANGDSYTTYNRVSVLTGCPTVLGWRTHEWLWKDDVKAVDARAADIKTIYTCGDVKEAQQLLEKYDVDYLYVGRLEREKYIKEVALDYDYLKSLGEVVYEDPEEAYYQTFLVKIK